MINTTAERIATMIVTVRPARKIHQTLSVLWILIKDSIVGPETVVRWHRKGLARLSLLKISTGLGEAGDFHEPAVPYRSWWRFSLALYRSSFSVFAAAPRSNSGLSLVSISWRFCVDNAPLGLSYHPWTGCFGCCFIESGHRSSTLWSWSNPQPWSNGIVGASGSTGAGAQGLRGGRGSAQTSVI